jgi:glycosyltransferase involved in cell wall biosynthesis
VKIALVSFHFSEYALSLAESLEYAGHQVLFLGLRENLDAELGVDQHSIRVSQKEILSHARLRDIRILSNIRRIVQSIQRFSPDIIHIQETLHDYLIAALPFLKRIAPLVLTVHDPECHSGSQQLTTRRLLYRHMLRSLADGFIVHGDALLAEMESLEPRKLGNIRVIPHGILGPDTVGEIPWVPGQLLFFGRIESYKGLGVLISSVRQIAEQGGQVTVVVAGHGPDLDQYRQQLSEDPNYTVLERFISKEEIPHLFQTSNVVALPYLDGTQSGIAAMAAKYGRPVVATMVGSIPEMVLHDETGLIVPPGDASALAAAIQRIVSDPPYGLRLGANAKRLGENELSWGRIAEKTIEAYESFKK